MGSINNCKSMKVLPKLHIDKINIKEIVPTEFYSTTSQFNTKRSSNQHLLVEKAFKKLKPSELNHVKVLNSARIQRKPELFFKTTNT